MVTPLIESQSVTERTGSRMFLNGGDCEIHEGAITPSAGNTAPEQTFAPAMLGTIAEGNTIGNAGDGMGAAKPGRRIIAQYTSERRGGTA